MKVERDLLEAGPFLGVFHDIWAFVQVFGRGGGF